MRRFEALGALYAAIATTIVGSAVAASSLIAAYPPLISQAARYAGGAAVLALVLRARGQPLPRLHRLDFALLLALALTGLVGFNLCLLGALRTSSPAAVGVIMGCVPVALALIAPLQARRAPGGRLLLAAIVVSLGAAVVQGAGSTTLPGFVFALGALGGEVAFSLLAVPLLPRLGPLALSAYVCAMAAAILTVAASVVDGPHALPAPTLPQAVAICYLALAVTAFAFLAWYSGLARLGAERAGLFAGLIPIGALLGGAVVGTGALTLPAVLGSTLVGAGVVLGLGAPPSR